MTAIELPKEKLAQIRQYRSVVLPSYQLRRKQELQSGNELFLSCARIYQQYPLTQLEGLMAANQNYLPPEIPLVYLIATRFRGLSLSQLEKFLTHTGLSAPFQQQGLPFVFILKEELRQFIRQIKLNRYMFGRNTIIREIHFLDTVFQHWNPFPPKRLEELTEEEKKRFQYLIPPYLHLLKTGIGDPFLLQVLKKHGWSSLSPAPQSLEKSPQIGLRQIISNYQLGDTGHKIHNTLSTHETLSPSYQQQLEQLLNNTLNPFQQDTYLPQLRECIQAVMQTTNASMASVEPLVKMLVHTCISQSAVQSQRRQEFVLYAIAQELILGTQNLKYRLNDCTRGLANALVPILAQSPQNARQLLGWTLEAILDTIMEIYESFSLADNTLRSFIDAFEQARQQFIHHQWQTLGEEYNIIK